MLAECLRNKFTNLNSIFDLRYSPRGTVVLSLFHITGQGQLRSEILTCIQGLETSWNKITHAQKPDFVFRRKVRVHLNRRERQFSRLLAAEVCASAVVMLDRPCSDVVWRVMCICCASYVYLFTLCVFVVLIMCICCTLYVFVVLCVYCCSYCRCRTAD